MNNIRSTRNDFVKGSNEQPQQNHKVILDSWKRCQKLQVDPFLSAAPIKRNGLSLLQHLESQKIFIEVSRPMMQALIQFVYDSGFAIALADKEGMLLEVMGRNYVKAQLAESNFCQGADFSEASFGTGGIGTSLATGEPVQVFANEHFCSGAHRWTCSAAPIYDPNGNLVGALDMVGPSEMVHPHTLGMVLGAAKAIENQLKTRKAWQKAELADKYKDTIIESMSEALIAVDQEGTITHINQAAVNIFKLPKDKLVHNNVHLAFGERNRELLKAMFARKLPTDREINIVTAAGKVGCTVSVRRITNGEGLVILLSEVTRARKLANRMTGATAKLGFHDIIGKNKHLQDAIRLSQAAAQTSSSVLLLGESGTGKDVFAQAIHNGSSRHKGPFVAINCGAIPRELISSELFGYTEGSFTGAKKGGNPGKFELAESGTIFLDEIGEVPLDLQTMLLRVLEEKALTRIGGCQITPIDVRIIAATNKDLREEVESGRFRHDLYYRLNVLTVKLPPLRKRTDDIPLLIDALLNKINSVHSKHPRHITEEVIKYFQSYPWPGNVRELQNILERIVAVHQEGVITKDMLPEELSGTLVQSSPGVPVEDYEKEIIIRLMKTHKGNISRIASELGVARTTLYRKLKKYGIK